MAFTIPVVEEFIVCNSGGCNRSTGISFSQGWVSDQVTTDDDTIDVHSLIFVNPPRKSGYLRFFPLMKYIEFLSPDSQPEPIKYQVKHRGCVESQ